MNDRRLPDDDHPVDPTELTSHTHAFVVKLWLEEQASAGEPATWRGHITHAYTRQQRHVQQLQEIVAFIQPYIEPWLEPGEGVPRE